VNSDSDNSLLQILLVDDEPDLREPWPPIWNVRVRRPSGGQRRRSARIIAHDVPDLVLLDIMMPGEDGLSLCRHLTEARAIPTIFLTARGEATDRIVGLEIGADDYVVKPFEPRELVARIRSVLRRAARGALPDLQSNEDFQFDGWRLDPLKRRLIAPIMRLWRSPRWNSGC
jgi:two-component system OmpR family response regulator